jgi:hypothetical protein
VRRSFTWLAQFSLGRKRLLDTLLAATYGQAGIRSLLTTNPPDFQVFGVFHLHCTPGQHHGPLTGEGAPGVPDGSQRGRKGQGLRNGLTLLRHGDGLPKGKWRTRLRERGFLRCAV